MPIVLITLVTLLVFAVLTRGLRRRAFAHGRCGRSRWDHSRWDHLDADDDGPRHGGRRHRARRRGRRGLSRVVAERLKRRLDVDEDQADLFDHAFRDLTDAASALSKTLKDSREDVADAFATDEVDDAKLAAVFTHHDEALTRARRDAVSALKQIHAVLDDDQRARAAEWLRAGPRSWR